MTSHSPQIELRHGDIQCTKHLDGRENIDPFIANGQTKLLPEKSVILFGKNMVGRMASHHHGTQSLARPRNSHQDTSQRQVRCTPESGRAVGFDLAYQSRNRLTTKSVWKQILIETPHLGSASKQKEQCHERSERRT